MLARVGMTLVVAFLLALVSVTVSTASVWGDDGDKRDDADGGGVGVGAGGGGDEISALGVIENPLHPPTVLKAEAGHGFQSRAVKIFLEDWPDGATNIYSPI